MVENVALRRFRAVQARLRAARWTRAESSKRDDFHLSAWQDSLPTQLERDTLLMPHAIAESVVQEAERFLQTELPAEYAARLAAKTFHLYASQTFPRGAERSRQSWPR